MDREQYEIETAVARQRAFLDAIAPIVREKVKLYSIAMPKIIIYPDGRTEHEYPQWLTEACAKWDEVIEQIAKSYSTRAE